MTIFEKRGCSIYVTGNPGNRAIRVLPGIFGQYAIYPFQDGNTSIAQNFWAIRVLPREI